MTDEARQEHAPVPPVTTNAPPAPTASASLTRAMALQNLIGNRATYRFIQRHQGEHPGPDGHTEAEHGPAGTVATESVLVPIDDPLAAIHRVSGFNRALRAHDSRLTSFSSIGSLQSWMFHPSESWIITESHIIVLGSGSSGMIRPRVESDPSPRGAGTVHLRLNNGRWMQLVLATPGNTVLIRPATAVDGTFSDVPVVMVASLPGVRLGDPEVRRIERLFRRGDEQQDGEQDEHGEPDDEHDSADQSAPDDGTTGAGAGRPRARELTAPWAMSQVNAANLEAEERRSQATAAAAGEESTDPASRLPSRIVSLPGEIARAERDSTRARARQQRWETGRQLLDRLIATLDRYGPPTERPVDPEIPESVPDWVRHQFGGARSLLQADRHRLLPLTEDARDARAATAAGPDATPAARLVEAEAQQAIERRLLERAAGLPERFELERNGRRPYAVAVGVGDRAARIRLQEPDSPSALYARVRSVAGQMAIQVAPTDDTESTLLQGQRAPYPIAIELMNTTTAVAGRAQWFRMEVDSGNEAPPRLAVTWMVSPVIGEGDDADIASTRVAEHGAVADQRRQEMGVARSESARSDLGIELTGDADFDQRRTDQAMVLTGERIGEVADFGRWVIGHIAERSAERGVIFARPGRFVVSVVAQLEIDESDREHLEINEVNVRAPSRTAITIDVVDTDERLDDLVEESLDEIEQREALLRQIEAVEAEIAQLDDDDDRLAERQTRLAELQAQLAELEEHIDVARGRGTATAFGHLGRKYDAATAQRDLVREIVNNMGAGDPLQQRHALIRHERQQAAAEQRRSDDDGAPAGELDDDQREPQIVLLYDQLHQRWEREINRGLERPPFAEWLTEQGDRLQQAADVASRQRSGLFMRGRDLGRATRLPAALIANDGRQLPLTLALQKATHAGAGGDAGTTTYQILDLSEVGAPNSSDSAPMFEGTAPGTDSAAAGTALQRAVMTYVGEAGYGYGQLVVHRPPTLTADVDFAPSQRFELRPSERERWIERLENIGIVVGMLGMVATGPVGIALGVIGAGSAATAAGLRMSQRSDRGTLDADSQTAQDLVDIVTAPLALAGAAASAGRLSRTGVIRRLEQSGVALTGDAAAAYIRGAPGLLNSVSDVNDIVGVVQAGSQIYLLPSGVIDGLGSAQQIENPTERRAAVLEALASGAIQLPGALHGLHGAHESIGELAATRARNRRMRQAVTPATEQGAGGGDHGSDTTGAPAAETTTTAVAADTTTAETTTTGTTSTTTAGTTNADATTTTTATAETTTAQTATADATTADTTASDTATTSTTDTRTGTDTTTDIDTTTTTTADSAEPGRVGAVGDGHSATAGGARSVGDQPGHDAGADSTPSESAGSDSGPSALATVIDHPSRTTAETALQSGDGLVALRRQLEERNLQPHHHATVAGAIQAARTAVVDAHVDSVLASVRAEHPDLHIDIQNLGTQGLTSDNDITVRVSPPVENPEHPLSETQRADLDRRLVTVSLETVPLLYESLEAAGLPPEHALDTNFYTDLREDSFRPADLAEARGIAADQAVVSMTEILLNVSPTEWADFQRQQLAAIESDGSIPSRDRAEMRERFRSEVAAAEATAGRLLGEAGGSAEGTADQPEARNAALDAARRRLVDGLAQQPPLSTRDIRRLMADVKLLEPDAFGTRGAVEGVVLGGQAMRGAVLVDVESESVRDDIGRRRRPRRQEAIDADLGSTGPLRWDPETGDLVESSAEAEVDRQRQAAHQHTAHRRPGDEHASGHDTYTRFLSAAQAIFGHLLHHIPGGDIEPPHTSTAAKHLHRIAELAARMGMTTGSGDGFSHLPDIIAAKQGDDAQQRTVAALRAWADEAGVAEWASPGDLRQAGDAALMGSFLRWASSQGGSLVGRMRRRAGHSAVLQQAEAGSTTTDGAVRSRRSAPLESAGGHGDTADGAIGTPRPLTSPPTHTTTSAGAELSTVGPHPGDADIVHLPDVRVGVAETFGREVPPASRFRQAENDLDFRTRWIAERPAERADQSPPAGYFERSTGTIHFPPHATMETVVHETLHALTHPDFYGAVPIWLNEGITEILTEQVSGSPSLDSVYADNIDIARLLVTAVGEDVMRAAYFDGDITGLQAALDAHTGRPDTLAALVSVLPPAAHITTDSAALAGIRELLSGDGARTTPSASEDPGRSERPTLPPPARRRRE